MKQLRNYQKKALTECLDALKETDEPVLLMASVGAGKSIILAELLLIFEKANKRALCIVNNAELVRNNAQTFKEQGGSPSIYCAALKQQDCSQNVVFGTPQSVLNGIKKNEAIGSIKFNIILVDEAHAINYKNHQTTFMRILRHYKQEYPAMRVLGATGTAFRYKGEPIVGDECLFKTQTGNITTAWLIEQGYLVKPKFEVDEELTIDFSSVKLNQMGKFDAKQLESVIEKNQRLTGKILSRLQSIMESQSRFGCFIFCSTLRHCAEAMQSLPEGQAAIITGSTPQSERIIILDKARRGEIKYLVNVQVLTVGIDVPGYDTLVFLRPTESLVLAVQMIGRALRLYPGKESCIASGQRVLTDVGLVAIENITKKMKIWDGVEFVSHCGIVLRGKQKVISYAGLTATEDHKIWTKEGWTSFGECLERRMPLCVTGNDGLPIKLSGGHLRSDNKKGKKSSRLLKNSMSRMSCNKRKISLQSKKENCWMQKMRKKKKFRQTMLRCSKMVNSKMRSSKTTLHKSERFQLSTLWSQRNSIQFQKPKCNGSMDIRQSWRSQRIAYRSNQQQWSLRNRKFKNNYIKNKYEQQKTQQRNEENALTKIESSRNKIFRQHANRNVFNRNDRRRYNQEILPKFIQAEREVWDILNCGPRNRFTCEGILVSNCLILDCVGNLERNSDWDDPVILDAIKQTRDKDEALIFPCPTCDTMNSQHARRCAGVQEQKRCDFYFEWKDCTSCNNKADITARYCPHCNAELIDPNAKLTMISSKPVTIEMDVIEAKYWIQESGKYTQFRAQYKVNDGKHFYESFTPTASEKAKNVFYGNFVKESVTNSSYWYPHLQNTIYLKAMLQHVQPPVRLKLKWDSKNWKIMQKFFPEPDSPQ